MKSPFVYLSPVARSIPFDNANTPGLPETELQSVIEHIWEDLGNADRYTFQATYGGNANVGRYLEFFPSIDSLEAPAILPETSRIVIVTAGTVSSSGDFTIGFFKSTDLVTPIGSITLLNGISRQTFALSIDVNAFDEIAVRVTSGLRVKPFMRIWAQKRVT